MRGTKLSIRSSLSSNENTEEESIIYPNNRVFGGRPSEEDINEEEEIAFIISEEKKKNKPTEEINSLGIPIGGYLYFGPPSTRLFDKHLKDLRKHWENQEVKYKITRNKGNSYKGRKTLFASIFRLFPKNGSSLKIKDIVLTLQKKGLLNKTVCAYSVVYKTIIRNNFVFLKTGRASFALRKGFRKWKKPEKIERVVGEQNGFPSLLQLVSSAVSQLTLDTKTVEPSDVYKYLKTFGFNGSWISIYNVMRSSEYKLIQ